MSHRIYTDLAHWFPLFTSPADYAEEAADALVAFDGALGRAPWNLLELGAGGGHLASHLRMPRVLVDLSPHMLAQSRKLNPDADHVVGDMRIVRLGRLFDGVLLHDAVMYMTTEADLAAALRTVRAHLAPGGAALVLPDFVAETYEPGTDTGGHDGDGRAIRYFEWSHPAEPGATQVDVDYVLVLRDGDGTEVVHDRHAVGIFPRATWLRLFREAGFSDVRIRPDKWGRETFVARG